MISFDIQTIQKSLRNFSLIFYHLFCSVPDPWYSGVDPDPDPRIHPLANGSGSGSWIKVKSHKIVWIKVFSYYFCMIEGSRSRSGSGAGSGSIHLTNGSGSRRPKNMWIRWIRIRIRNIAFLLPRAFTPRVGTGTYLAFVSFVPDPRLSHLMNFGHALKSAYFLQHKLFDHDPNYTPLESGLLPTRYLGVSGVAKFSLSSSLPPPPPPPCSFAAFLCGMW